MSEGIFITDILTFLNLQPVDSQILEQYPPVISIENGESELHEESHVMRVIIYAELICQFFEKLDIHVNRHAILSAIRIHDGYRRQEYNDEKDHGYVAMSHAYFNQIFVDDPSEKLILDLARWHSVDDEEILNQTGWEELPLELKIFKDADALDRYRDAYHDQVDGVDPNPEYFRLNVTHKLMPVAQAFCESYFGTIRHRNKSVAENIIAIGESIGIIDQHP